MNMTVSSGFWDRAIRNLRGAWEKIAAAEDDFDAASLSPDLSDTDRERLIEQMRACLETRGGEVSARRRAAALGHAYLTLNDTGRRRFIGILVAEFDTDHAAIDLQAAQLKAAQGVAERQRAERRLRDSLTAPWVKILTQFNGLPEGIKFLVDLRAELIGWLRETPSLAPVEADLKDLLSAWFDVGFLELRQITWQAPAALLEKLFAYEAVHEIQSWDDLKNRLAADRRCFAFFHPRMPDEPLIIVWVALVNGIAGNIQTLLDEAAPLIDADRADAAIFYSISNAQDGLKGINFGNFLIKRVVDNLAGELSGIKTFATLSPIPGFRRWLDTLTDDAIANILPPQLTAELAAAITDQQPAGAAIKALLANPTWHLDATTAAALRGPLLRLVAGYLINVKRPGSRTADDSVAHFHLNNGARIEQLNWAADLSAKGLNQAAGIMLNYRYELAAIDANHEQYRASGTISASNQVRTLLKD